MDTADWLTDEMRGTKKVASQQCLKYIADLSLDLDAHPSSKVVNKRVKTVECDYGVLVAYRRGSRIHHYLIPEPGSVLERGVENWPRGSTALLDRMCQALDAAIVNDSREENKQWRKILDGPNGIRARRMAEERAAERSSSKKGKRKKKRGKARA